MYLNKNYCYIDIKSLIYLKDFLLKKNNYNKYISYIHLDNTSYNILNMDTLKEIALSNNELILIDNGNIKDIHRILANKIIKGEDLEKESF